MMDIDLLRDFFRLPRRLPAQEPTVSAPPRYCVFAVDELHRPVTEYRVFQDIPGRQPQVQRFGLLSEVARYLLRNNDVFGVVFVTPLQDVIYNNKETRISRKLNAQEQQNLTADIDRRGRL